ncbi:MAG: hypothetical protein JOZ89_00840 [Gammaproteobacteria bacterium]|nr:hypothetical protein [Gammaproteobacteria bacterium]
MTSDELAIWLNHFEHHAQHPRALPSGIPDILTQAERCLISRSIATFQLGEQSEGATLLRAAERFACERGQPSLARIVRLFIAEEQHHAALLKDFMEDHGIALKRRDWTDRVFRLLRRLAGLELYLYVLITAELIGILYYRALEAVTECERLKLLCRTLVCEELAHVGFESQLLLALRAGRPGAVRSMLRLAHRMFLAATASVVWLTQRPVLRCAGYGASRFLCECLDQYGFYLEPVGSPSSAATRDATARASPRG